MNTPWGPSQTQDQIADGIVFLSTASHGGYHLSAERWKILIGMFPAFKPWAVPQWLEKDCDACLVALAFPGLFDDQAIFNAIRGGRTWRPEAVTPAWEQTDHGRACVARYEAFKAQVQDRWESGGMFAPVEGHPEKSWGVHLRRGEEHKVVVFPSYPEGQFFTEAEIAGLPVIGGGKA